MPFELERTFLVKRVPEHLDPVVNVCMRQAYLNTYPDEVRIRECIWGGIHRYYLSVKRGER